MLTGDSLNANSNFLSPPKFEAGTVRPRDADVYKVARRILHRRRR
jgi:hypothetical protein